jgi:hypothetical protein
MPGNAASSEANGKNESFLSSVLTITPAPLFPQSTQGCDAELGQASFLHFA